MVESACRRLTVSVLRLGIGLSLEIWDPSISQARWGKIPYLKKNMYRNVCVCFHYQVWLANDKSTKTFLSFHHGLFFSPTTSHRPSPRRFLQNWGSLMTSCITAVRHLGSVAFRSHGGSQLHPVMDDPCSIETHGGVRTPSFRTHAVHSFVWSTDVWAKLYFGTAAVATHQICRIWPR